MVDNYLLGRDLYGSMRLDAQHLLWKLYNGWTLNPRIPVRPNMKVAEIGTGTGMWLLDLASQVPQCAQLDGYDLSAKQFPSELNLPASVTFSVLDAFGEVPENLVHTYDVVHLRFWCCIVRKNDPSRLIRHAARLLKPGGFLQWEDADIGKTVVRGAIAEEFARVATSAFTSAGLQFDWLDEIEEHVRQQGLGILHSDHGALPSNLIPLCTSTYLAGHIELFRATETIESLHTAEKSEGWVLLQQLLAGVRKDASYHWRPIALLAQAPLRL